MSHPCLRCGACCAAFRVAFHWSEVEPALGGRVPVAMTEPLRAHERAMRGTSRAAPRCIALDADIGRTSRCTIHARRPSVCAEVQASWEFGLPSPQCDRARASHGLAPLAPGDWLAVEGTISIAVDPVVGDALEPGMSSMEDATTHDAPML